MFVMNQISTKPVWVKNGADLAKEFCKRVDQQSEGADIVIIGFEWYSDDSLKSMTWRSRNSKGKLKKRNDYSIEPDTDLTPFLLFLVTWLIIILKERQPSYSVCRRYFCVRNVSLCMAVT